MYYSTTNATKYNYAKLVEGSTRADYTDKTTNTTRQCHSDDTTRASLLCVRTCVQRRVDARVICVGAYVRAFVV